MRPLGIAVLGAALLSTLLLSGGHADAARSKTPYARIPSVGDTVRLDGTVGGSKAAWAYYEQAWLESYLRATIDAAEANKPYSDMTDQINRVAAHVVSVANGTKASVEVVQPFTYKEKMDMEVRVLLQEGPHRGREVWTTCGEVVDSSGHPFVRM